MLTNSNETLKKPSGNHWPKPDGTLRRAEVVIAHKVLELGGVEAVWSKTTNERRAVWAGLARVLGEDYGIRTKAGKIASYNKVSDRLRIWRKNRVDPEQLLKTYGGAGVDIRLEAQKKLSPVTPVVEHSASDYKATGHSVTGHSAAELKAIEEEFIFAGNVSHELEPELSLEPEHSPKSEPSPEMGLPRLSKGDHKILDFYGDHITSVLGDDGKVYVPMRQLSENFGLDWASQFKKLRENELFEGTVMIITTVGADSKNRKQVCLEADMVPYWISTLNPGKVKPEVRYKLKTYIKECVKILKDVWMGPGFAVNPNPARVDIDAMLEKAKEYNVKKLELSMKAFNCLKELPAYDLRVVGRYIEQDLSDMHNEVVDKPSPFLYIDDYLKNRGFRASEVVSYRCMMGKRVKKRYREIHQKDPPKTSRMIDGRSIDVFSYTSEDLPILDRAFEELQANIKAKADTQ